MGGIFANLLLYRIVCLCIIQTALSLQKNVVLSSEKKLIIALINQYSEVTPHGRPVMNASTPVPVKLGLGLIQMELDEKEKALALSLWAKYVWLDEYLRWEPSEYNNIVEVKLPTSVIWAPDIMLYNTAETETFVRDTLATIYNNGTVLWVPHQRIKSSCSIDVTNFPFDKQKCHMWFGSWTYTTRDINLTMAFDQGIDLTTFHSDFKDTSQWAITSTLAERRVLPSDSEEPNYSVLTYTLELKRNLVFASYILTLPCVFLACLTLVVFWLPPDRPDRTALAMSIFASFLLLLLILVEAAPPTATSIPLLGIYYCFNMVIIMLAVFLSSLVVNICQMGDSGRQLPKWLRKVTLEGPLKYMCICTSFTYYKSEKDITENHRYFIPETGMTRRYEGKPLLIGNGANTVPLHELNHNNHTSETAFCSAPSRDFPPMAENAEDLLSNMAADFNSPYGILAQNIDIMSKCLRQVETILFARMREETLFRRRKKDWKSVAIVMDRVFFLIYVLIIILSVSIMFPRPM